MTLKDTTISQMNALGKKRIPFLFIIPFDSKDVIIQPLESVNSNDIKYDFNGITNVIKTNEEKVTRDVSIPFLPYDLESYKEQFDEVQSEIAYGNTYLINLTTKTSLLSKIELEDVFDVAKAKYKLFYKDLFCCFSPEIFIQIRDNSIYSFPMKGTIDGSIENAKEILLNDSKETAEHYTIVDLIRNDLNLVSKNVKVDRFRYMDRIETHKGSILQMSSQISGSLDASWNENLGTIFSKLLPAGSITGAPKERTVEIIKSVETYDRGYYTGVAGIFDGKSVDSGVLIRFIEKEDDGYCYKSGGGITMNSDLNSEYKELQHKIYIPK